MADPIQSRDATLVRQDASGVLTLPNDQRLEIRAGNVTITLENGNVTIQSIGNLRIDGSTIEINAAQVQLNAPVVHASGVVNCDTIIARSVIGSSYTPGAGNIW
jgi:hypothetical protein